MRKLLAIAMLVLAGLLAGCGGSDSAKERPAAGGTPSASPTQTAAPKADAAAAVRIVDFDYDPRKVTVDAGTKLTWSNKDSANHTVTFEQGPGDLGNVDPGRSLSATFDEPGTYAYVCQYHPSMKGTVTVR